MNLVKQEEEFGCAVACAAMILNRSYIDVRQDFENDFGKRGVPLNNLIEYIGAHGYSAIKKKPLFANHKNSMDAELLKPFAEAHLIEYMPQFDAKDSHVVVMDDGGRMFCPSGTDVDFGYKIRAVVGFYR